MRPVPTEASAEIRLAGFRATVQGPCGLIAQLSTVFPGTRLSGPEKEIASASFWVFLTANGDHRIVRDGTVLWPRARGKDALALLEVGITQTAIFRLAPQYFLFHAACVAHSGKGVLIPAAAHSGKTTLVAGLVAAGFQYLSDDVAPFDPRSREVWPFQRSLAVKAGARRILQGLYPQLASVPARRRADGRWIWYLTPSEESLKVGRVPLRYVVVPNRRRGARAELDPLPRSQALHCLIAQTFAPGSEAARPPGSMIEALSAAECYQLTYGDLGEAVGLISELAGVEQACARGPFAPAGRGSEGGPSAEEELGAAC